MKIVIWIYRLGGGGAERVMTDLASSFVRAGHDVDVCVHGPDNPYAAEIEATAKLHILTRSCIIEKLRLRTVCSFFRLIQFIHQNKPDVVFTTGAGHGLLLPFVRFFSFSSFGTVLRETNNLTAQAETSTRFMTRLVIMLTGILYRFNDWIIVPSKGVEDDLLQRIPSLKSRITRIANPIDAAKLHALAEQPLSIPTITDQSYILGVGRLVPQKGFDVLIRAWAELYKAHPLKLILLGEGPERGKLSALAQSYGLASELVMPGFEKNPYAYMRRARLFVLSSYHEGLPNSLLQALACNCPVVSTDCPSGPAEILDNGKLAPLVAIGNSAALLEGMLQALDYNAPYPKSPWAQISYNYYPENISRAYLSIFDHLVERQGRQA
ncbi:MAG TPA: glycosyltransferase [Micavibrio sp.]|nr:glycosyltransferase [Micavibrio sp.]